jgi:hypothetical protein
MALTGKMSQYSTLQIMKHTVSKEGVAGLYKGAFIAMMGVVMYKGFGFAFYEKIYKMNSALNIPETSLNFISGSLAGLAGQFSKGNF